MATNYFHSWDGKEHALGPGSPLEITFDNDLEIQGWTRSSPSEFICPETGQYAINGSLNLIKAAGPQELIRVTYTLDGVNRRPTWTQDILANEHLKLMPIHTIITIMAGQVLKFRAVSDGTNVSIKAPPNVGNAYSAMVTIHKL